MSRVIFTFKGGRTVNTNEAQARLLERMGKGTYQTRDMADQPVITKPLVAATPKHAEPAADDDGLDGLDREQLHELAKERGVKVHHMAGVEKVRLALREAA